MNCKAGVFLASLIGAFVFGATYSPDGTVYFSDAMQNAPECSITEPGWPKTYSCLQAIRQANPSTTSYMPTCAVDAAEEYKIPKKVFHALVLEAKSNWEGKPNHYGPMGLYDLIIPIAADGIDAPESAVRSDPCVNYQAAAWWLMNQAGGSTGDVWEAVAVYYHGRKDRESYPMRDRVRSIYEQL